MEVTDIMKSEADLYEVGEEAEWRRDFPNWPPLAQVHAAPWQGR